MKFVGILALLACGLFQIASASDKVVVCYLGTWARYRSGNGQYLLSHIDTSLCTHLIYAFVGINTNGSVVTLDSWLDYNLDYLNAFNKLKESNSNLKTLLAIGGWNEGSLKYSTVAADANLRSVFVKSALEWVQKYNFDGFDIDWEYPAQRGGASVDKENYVLLLKELREVFDEHNLIITAAVAASPSSAAISYDIPALSQYLDYINIMAYDLHGSYDGVTGHNAPLDASSIDTTEAQKELNIKSVINYWINSGASPSKIVLGLPAYGRTFTLSDSSNVALGAPCSAGGTAGPYTVEAGMLGYHEIVENFNTGGWTIVWDDEQQVPHAYKGDQWVGYDNPQSIKLKTEYALEQGLGGVMFWSLEMEDFLGLSNSKYPLLSAANEALAAGSSSDSSSSTSTTTKSTEASTTSTTTKSTTDASSSTSTSTSSTSTSTSSSSGSNDGSFDSYITCESEGFVRAPNNCAIFYYCTQVGGIAAAQSCQTGLKFDITVNVCNWQSLVEC